MGRLRTCWARAEQRSREAGASAQGPKGMGLGQCAGTRSALSVNVPGEADLLKFAATQSPVNSYAPESKDSFEFKVLF